MYRSAIGELPWAALSCCAPGGGAVLCFHGIREDSPQGAHITGETLRKLVEAVSSTGRIVALAELLTRLVKGKDTRNLVAITFDDAYQSLSTKAMAALREPQIPFTVFPVSEVSRSASAFWWDRIDHLHAAVPSSRWREFEQEIGVPGSYREGQPTELGPLRPLRQWLLREHLGRWPRDLEPALSKLEAEAGTKTQERAMSFTELEAFTREPQVDVGVHSMTHPVLPLLSEEEAVAEVGGAYRILRDVIPKTLPILAVPFGLYDARTEAVAANAGMQAFLTLQGHSLRRARPGHGVPRFSISGNAKPWKLRVRISAIGDVIGGADPDAFPALPSTTS